MYRTFSPASYLCGPAQIVNAWEVLNMIRLSAYLKALIGWARSVLRSMQCAAFLHAEASRQQLGERIRSTSGELVA